MKSSHYISWLLRRRCFPDFHRALGYKSDLKEWTECAAMYHQIAKEFYNLRRGGETWKVGNVYRTSLPNTDPIDIFDIGCGVRPTLGILCALMLPLETKTVISIDPILRNRPPSGIDDLWAIPEHLEDWTPNFEPVHTRAIIAANHAHVPYKTLRALADLYEDSIIITCPCCVNNRPPKGEFITDKYIWSPKNTIYIERL